MMVWSFYAIYKVRKFAKKKHYKKIFDLKVGTLFLLKNNLLTKFYGLLANGCKIFYDFFLKEYRILPFTILTHMFGKYFEYYNNNKKN